MPNSAQWYLNNTGQAGGTPGMDLNVMRVWEDYTGEGVTVAVYDDGVQADHWDLDANYDADLHLEHGITFPNGGSVFEVNHGAPEPGDYHGTMAAGIIAAERNGRGATGVAYDATLVGVDIANQSPRHWDFLPWTDQQYEFDVVNHSWKTAYFGQSDNPAEPSTLKQHLADAADLGREGLGTIVVSSAANDREGSHNTNGLPIAGDRHVVTVGAIDHTGYVTTYSNPGASLLVTAFADREESAPIASHIYTTQPYTPDGTIDRGTYFGGTSASAPQVAGVAALMLEANPDLGWRDVQDIFAISARGVGTGFLGGTSASEQDGWEWNGADNWNGGGMHFSTDYGFGLVDALAAVRLAESWDKQSTSANEGYVGASILRRVTDSVTIPDNTVGGIVRTFQVNDDVNVEKIELDLGINHTRVGDLRIMLTSPDGTDSIILDRAGGNADLNRWTFSSNEFRGESAVGQWTLRIEDLADDPNPAVNDRGFLTRSTLHVYGSEDTVNDTYFYTNEFARLSTPPQADNGPHGFVAFDDDGGTDTINAAAVTSNTIIDLEGEEGMGYARIAGVERWFSGGGGGGPDFDPYAQLIENVIGGDGADELSGNIAANVIEGWRGADRLDGRSGDDTLTGGAGTDAFVYANGWGHDTITDFAVGVDVLDMTAVTGLTSRGQLTIADSDTVPGATTVTFGTDSITLLGVQTDQLSPASFRFAGQSFDGASAWGGAVVGGDGVDTLSYADATYAIYVDLLREGGYAEGLNGASQSTRLSSIENITGAPNNFNYLHGSHQDNVLIGGESYDWLTGRGGSNTLDGRGGIDLADYYETDAPVTIDLGRGTAVHSTGTDTLVGIEQARGTNKRDTFIGDGVDNYFHGMNDDDSINGQGGRDWLDGSGENDSISGGQGEDRLIGGPGDDRLWGGTEADLFVYNDGYPSHDRIFDFNAAEGDRIDFSALSGVDSLADLAIASDGAAGTLLVYGTNSIALIAVAPTDVASHWFAF